MVHSSFICTTFFPLAYISCNNSLIPGLLHLQILPVKLQAENAWGRGHIGYQMFAGICGAILVWVCTNLGFIVHTLCHYCEMVATACSRQQGLKTFRGGLKNCKLRMRVKCNFLVRTNIFLHLQLIHTLALSPSHCLYCMGTC